MLVVLYNSTGLDVCPIKRTLVLPCEFYEPGYKACQHGFSITLDLLIFMLCLLLQIEVVTGACIKFLLQPNRLTPHQLAELYLQTCHLTSAEAQQQALQQALQLLVSMPWTQPVYSALCDVFKQLLQSQPELCKELLLNGASGHMCGIQVGFRVC